MKKNIIVFILALAMIISAVPFQAFANESVNYATNPETAKDDQVVKIPDEALRVGLYKAIKNMSWKMLDIKDIKEEEITVGALKKLKKLDIHMGDNKTNKKVRDLTGMEFATALENVDLAKNSIEDITPIKISDALRNMKLHEQSVSISPETPEVKLPIKAHEQDKVTYKVDGKYGTIENNVLKLKKQDQKFTVEFDSHQGGFHNSRDVGGTGVTIVPSPTYDFKGKITVDVSKVRWEKPVEKGTVYFKDKDGKKIYEDENKTITLDVTKEGTFHLEGEETKDVEVEKFISEEKYTVDKNHSGYPIKNGEYGYHYLIDANRNFNPRTIYDKPKAVKVRFNHKGKNTEEKTFFINIIPSEIQEIRALKDGKVIGKDAVNVKGSERTFITVEGKKKGSEKFEPLSTNAYYLKDKPKQHIMKNSFILWTSNEEHVVEVFMKDNADVNCSFKAKSGHVGVEDFTISVPKRWPIHKWNKMSEKFSGIMQYDESDKNKQGNPKGFVVKMKPENASSWETKWEALTPEIAEYDPLHSNGIVPKKPGKAKFRVSSVLNPKLVKDVEVEFYYEKPLESVDFHKNAMDPVNGADYRIKAGENKELDIIATPEHASEQRFNWTYSKDGIVEVKDTVNVDVENVDTEKWTTHTLKGLKNGKVEVTGTPIDDTKGAKPIKFTVVVGNPYPEWKQEKDGSWYVEANGEKKTGWFEDKDKYPGWYYFDKDGKMQTGWLQLGNTWYYLKSSGAMATGWEQVGSTWYYLKSSGAMATGWEQVGSTWYYLKSSGAMATGWEQVGSTWYYLKSTGAMATGWEQVGSTWYYLKSSGAMATGWEKVGNTWYKFASSGAWIK
ncbi:hypothetical protein ACGCUQ_06635 [Eubacteriales bacterium KG127]